MEEPTRLECYLAEALFLLFEIPSRVWGKNTGLKPLDFLLKFRLGDKDAKVPEPPTEEEKKRRAEVSKAAWRTLFAAVRRNAEITPARKSRQNASESIPNGSGQSPPAEPFGARGAPRQSDGTPPGPPPRKPRKPRGV
jgi:hypothetical protein